MTYEQAEILIKDKELLLPNQIRDIHDSEKVKVLCSALQDVFEYRVTSTRYPSLCYEDEKTQIFLKIVFLEYSDKGYWYTGKLEENYPFVIWTHTPLEQVLQTLSGEHRAAILFNLDLVQKFTE